MTAGSTILCVRGYNTWIALKIEKGGVVKGHRKTAGQKLRKVSVRGGLVKGDNKNQENRKPREKETEGQKLRKESFMGYC